MTDISEPIRIVLVAVPVLTVLVLFPRLLLLPLIIIGTVLHFIGTVQHFFLRFAWQRRRSRD